MASLTTPPFFKLPFSIEFPAIVGGIPFTLSVGSTIQVLHELGHNLGALQSGAPNAFDGAHCDDDNNDTMCYTGEAGDQVSSPDAQFDYRKDDYWDPGASKSTTQNPDGSPSAPTDKLGWWALNLSHYICPLPTGATAATAADCSLFNTNPGY